MSHASVRLLRQTSLAMGVAVALGAGVAMAPSAANAVPLTVTFDPSGAGLGGNITPFNSVTQNGLDLARAVIQADGSFVETGVLRFDIFNSPTLQPILNSGLGSTYGLYLTFTATGTLNGFNSANPAAPTSGNFSSISYSLIGDPGNGNTLTGATNSTNPVLTDVGNNDILLASGGALLSNAVSINSLGIPTASVVLTMTQEGTSFFLAPPNVNVFAASFTNSPGTFTFAQNPDGSTSLAIAGSFNNNYDAIPEPAPLAALGVGLLALGLLRRNWSRNDAC